MYVICIQNYQELLPGTQYIIQTYPEINAIVATHKFQLYTNL